MRSQIRAQVQTKGGMRRQKIWPTARHSIPLVLSVGVLYTRSRASDFILSKHPNQSYTILKPILEKRETLPTSNPLQSRFLGRRYRRNWLIILSPGRTLPLEI